MIYNAKGDKRLLLAMKQSNLNKPFYDVRQKAGISYNKYIQCMQIKSIRQGRYEHFQTKFYKPLCHSSSLSLSRLRLYDNEDDTNNLRVIYIAHIHAHGGAYSQRLTQEVF